MIVLIKHLPCCNQDSVGGRTPDQQQQAMIQRYFQGHKRVTANYVQGKFKNNFLLSEILTGQTFHRPLAHLPAHFLTRVALGFIRTIAPGLFNFFLSLPPLLFSSLTFFSLFFHFFFFTGLHADVLSPQPHLLTPLIAAAQTVHVAHSAEEAPSLQEIVLRQIEDIEIESTVAMGPKYQNMNMTANKRRKYFKENIQNEREEAERYDPQLIYTFGFWQDLFDPFDYAAHLPFGSFDLTKYLDGQPMSIQARIGIGTGRHDGKKKKGKGKGKKEKETKILWDVKLWHQKLLPKMNAAEEEGRLRMI